MNSKDDSSKEDSVLARTERGEMLISLEDGTDVLVYTIAKPLKVSRKIATALNKAGWNFDWSREKNVHALYVEVPEESEVIQGLISLKVEGGYIEVEHVESAPHNRGKSGKYARIGKHLFAFAAKVSYDLGFDGYLALTPKTKLISHYESYGFKSYSFSRMVLEQKEAVKLIDLYYGGE